MTRIAYLGQPGSYSDLACRIAFPGNETLGCVSFPEVFAAASDGRAGLAMIPVDNSLAGRIADVHHLLPESDLHIVGEHFQRIEHHLLAPKGATLASIKTVKSHVQPLGQCRRYLQKMGYAPVASGDSATAAKEVAEAGDPSVAAISSSLSGEIYGLVSLAKNIEDEPHNTTRFLVMAREADWPKDDGRRFITSFLYRVRSVPASLYKSLGGFATNGINLTKLESYMVGGFFEAAQFYVEAEGHPEQRPMKLALEELAFFSRKGTFKILGVYPAHPFRQETDEPADD
jgi:prephenate dehydratase